MGAIAARRAVFLIPTILGVNVVVFLMLHFTPGDPAVTILGPLATHSQIVHLRQTMGLNQPLWQQFGLWLWNVLHLDFGHSYIRGVDVRPLVFARLQATLLLVGASLVLSTVLGVGVGVLSAARRNSVVDRL